MSSILSGLINSQVDDSNYIIFETDDESRHNLRDEEDDDDYSDNEEKHLDHISSTENEYSRVHLLVRSFMAHAPSLSRYKGATNSSKIYTQAPELTTSNYKVDDSITRYVPNVYGYLRFPQVESNLLQIHRDLLRSLWYECFYGGDYAAAAQVLSLLCDVDMIDTDDLHRFFHMMQQLPHNEVTKEILENLAASSFRLKYQRKAIAKQMDHELLLLLLGTFVKRKEYIFIKQQLKQRVFLKTRVKGPAMKAYMGVLICIEAIELVENAVQTSNKYDSTMIPTIYEIAKNPFLIYYIIEIIVKYKDTVNACSSCMQELKEYLEGAYRINQTLADFIALYVAYLEACGRHKDATKVVKSFINKSGEIVNHRHFVVRYLCQFRPSQIEAIFDAIGWWVPTSQYNEQGVYCMLLLFEYGHVDNLKLFDFVCNTIEIITMKNTSNQLNNMKRFHWFLWRLFCHLLGPIEHRPLSMTDELVIPTSDLVPFIDKRLVSRIPSIVQDSFITEFREKRLWWYHSIFSVSSLNELVWGLLENDVSQWLYQIGLYESPPYLGDLDQCGIFTEFRSNMPLSRVHAVNISPAVKAEIEKELTAVNVRGFDKSERFQRNIIITDESEYTSKAGVFMPNIYARFLNSRRDFANRSRILYLAPKLMNILTFQVIVCSSLMGQDCLFVVRSIQLLCLQEDSNELHACLHLLHKYSINILRAISLANVCCLYYSA